MIFNETDIQGLFLIEPERLSDSRGFFARSYCEEEFEKHNIKKKSVQSNISFNKKKGTLRGMHFQREPNAEAKLVRCTLGSIYDVVIDLRQESPTFKHWCGFELNQDNRNALYIPEGMAHGFQTLEDNTEVFYQMFNYFAPESAGGIRWNDKAFNISWPINDSLTISEKDKSYSDYDGFCL